MPNGMNGRLRFDQVDELSDAFAGYLRQTLGRQAGDRVAVQMPNCLRYPVVSFGVLKTGCVLVNDNPLYSERERVHQFNDSGAKGVLATGIQYEPLAVLTVMLSINTTIRQEVLLIPVLYALFIVLSSSVVTLFFRRWATHEAQARDRRKAGVLIAA